MSYWVNTATSLVPKGIRGFWGRRFAKALGLIGELLEAYALQAFRVDFPSRTPDDGLQEMGESAGIFRGYGESIAEYRKRVMKRWDWAQMRGTVKGIKASFAAIGCPNVEILDDLPRLKDRRQYVVVIRPPSPWADKPFLVWDDAGLWDDPRLVWDANGVDPKWLEVAMKIVKYCRCAASIPAELVIVFSGDVDAQGLALPGAQVFQSDLLGDQND